MVTLMRAVGFYQVGIAAGALLLAGIAGQVGCSAGGPAANPAGNPTPTETTGVVAMKLTLPGGAQLNTVSWVITSASGAPVKSGNVALQGSQSVSFTVGGLAPATGYTVTLTGTTVDGTVTCSGSATFAITARSVTYVTDLLQCSPTAGEAGAAQINAPIYDCAAIASISESPSEAVVGGSMSFAASATAANPAGVTYAWSAPSGTFSNSTAASTGFTCTTSGTIPVTLAVADGQVPEGGACNASLATQTFQVQCDPNSCPAIASLLANPQEVPVGETIALSASAAFQNPASIGYSWSVTSGVDGGVVGVLGTSQDEAAGPSDANSFLCIAPGTATITVVVDGGAVSDAGASSDAGSCPAALTTTTTTVVCDSVPENQVRSAWVELGPSGVAVARAITAASTCPTITVNGASQAMSLRVAAANEPLRTTSSASLGPQYSKPSYFPVSTCETTLPAGATSAVVAGQNLPLPKANPTKVVVLGDTGCRLKAAIPASGSQYQGCSDPTQYPFAELATLAASLQPDVVVHVGDYQYRENECPPNQANCAGSPWGYGWDTWEADFFAPAANLLAAAPWIVTRGNHEQCTRAGQGWFRFLDPSPYTETRSCNSPANDAVLQPSGILVGGAYSDPYAVPLGPNSQVVVFDSNNVGAAAVTPGGSSNFLTYQAELQTAGAFATSKSMYNIWSNHHPILGFAPNAGAPPSPGNLDLLSVMAQTYPDTYFPPNINFVVHGHTHLFEGIDFASTNYPATIVTGNAGTLLDIALPDPFPTSVHPDPAGKVTVATVSDTAGFGFIFMQYTGGVWVSSEVRLDGSIRTVCTTQLNGQMTCTANGYVP